MPEPRAGAVQACRRRGPQDDLLHVRLPVRHQRPSQGRQDPLHRGQPRPPGQPRRALRQGLGRDHAALCAGEAVGTAVADRAARFRRIHARSLGRGARYRRPVAGRGPPQRSPQARLLHRPRPMPVADRMVGARSSAPPTTPPMAASARSIWPPPASTRSAARSGSSARRTGSTPASSCCSVSPRTTTSTRSRSGLGQAQGAGRQGRLGQPGAHRLFRHCRQMARHHARHRRALDAGPGARAPQGPAQSTSTICPLLERRRGW